MFVKVKGIKDWNVLIKNTLWCPVERNTTGLKLWSFSLYIFTKCTQISKPLAPPLPPWELYIKEYTLISDTKIWFWPRQWNQNTPNTLYQNVHNKSLGWNRQNATSSLICWILPVPIVGGKLKWFINHFSTLLFISLSPKVK